jgi:hypothetical protein
MSSRSKELEQRRLALQEQISAERDLVAAELDDIERRFSPVDRAVSGIRSFVHSPVAVVIGIAALALIGPSRVLRFASRGVVLLTAARRVTRLIR